MQFFFQQGLPLNSQSEDGECPLSAAIDSQNEELVRWMLANGADPTISIEPIISAAYTGNVNIVKLLVEHGANYNCVFGPEGEPRTPLSLALMYGRTEVADYLRTIGAIIPMREPKVEGFHDELIAYFREQTGRSADVLGMQEIIPGVVTVTVHNLVTEEHLILFTSGMSARPMTAPSGQEELQYAEMVLFLPPDWPIRPPLNGPHAWPWIWLRILAHYPHENGTWLGGPFSTFSNDDPPQPLAEGCPFNSFLLTYNQHFPAFKSSDGRLINLITAIPLYHEELAITKSHPYGFVELYRRFEKFQVHPGDKYPRRNLAK